MALHNVDPEPSRKGYIILNIFYNFKVFNIFKKKFHQALLYFKFQYESHKGK